jgi:hypothetical protein
MPTIGIHLSVTDKAAANQIRRDLANLAKQHGYLDPHARPSPGDLLIAIAAGEIALVLLPDEHITQAIERLEIIGEEWSDSIVIALKRARERQEDE